MGSFTAAAVQAAYVLMDREATTAKVVDLGVSDEWVAWFRDTVSPDTVTVVLLVEALDTDALVTEAKRFTGAELVYANLDDETIKRVEAALEA